MTTVTPRPWRAAIEAEQAQQDAQDIQQRLLDYELDPRNFTQAMRQASRLAMRGQRHPRLTRRVL